MWAELTWNAQTGQYEAPAARIYKSPEPFTDREGIQHPSGVYRSFSREKLLSLGRVEVIYLGSPASLYEYKTGETQALNGTTLEVTQTFSTRPLEFIQNHLKQVVKAKRNTVRDAGIEWSPDGGVTIFAVHTDADSRREMTGAVVATTEDPSIVAQAWRMLDDSFPVLEVSTFKAMALAVRAHVNACYVRQAELEVAIDGATVTQLTDPQDPGYIDVTAGWPTIYTTPA